MPPRDPTGTEKYTQTAPSVVGKVPVHVKAGLCFPATRIKRYMKEGRLAEHISVKAAISMAAVLEFLAAEVLELASENVAEDKRPIIKPRHINLGIRGDDELARLVGEQVIIPTGGVIPYIHPELETKPQKKRRRVKKLEENANDN